MTDTVETPVEAVETVDAVETAPEPTEAVESKARRLGWRPKEEFKGDEGRWVDADTFVKRGEEILPIVQANNKALEKEIKGLKATLKEFADNYTRVEQRAYATALRDLEARQAQAVEDNDVQAVRQITREMADLNKEVRDPEPATPTEDPLLTDWKDDNPWFGQDAIMRGAAVEIVNELIADGVTDLGRQLRAVDKRMREAFPQKFGNARRAAPQTVEGGVSRARTGAKTINDLPPEARATALRWERQGLMTVAQYVKDYQF